MIRVARSLPLLVKLFEARNRCKTATRKVAARPSMTSVKHAEQSAPSGSRRTGPLARMGQDQFSTLSITWLSRAASVLRPSEDLNAENPHPPTADKNCAAERTGTPYCLAFCALVELLSGSAATSKSQDFFVTLDTGWNPCDAAI